MTPVHTHTYTHACMSTHTCAHCRRVLIFHPLNLVAVVSEHVFK